MLSRTLFLCLLAAVFSAGSALSCKWIDHKFRQCSENCLNLLETMANNSTNTTGPAAVTFPNDLYSQASKDPAEAKVGFTVQVLEEVLVLFEEDHSSASWEQITVENFLSVIARQAENLRSCVSLSQTDIVVSETKSKLHKHFVSLSRLLKKKNHSAESWELIRKKIKRHLQRVDLLVSSVRAADN